MISQLLDEPYIESMPEVRFLSQRLFSIVSPSTLADILVMNVTEIPNFQYDFNGPIIKSNEELIKLFNDHMTEIESDLLFSCFESDPESDFSVEFEEMNLQDRCKTLGIGEYLSDRNLNTLAFYSLMLRFR